MSRFKKLIMTSICLIVGISFTTVGSVVYAKEESKDTVIKEKYYYDIAENAGDDGGYYPTTPIEPDDVHYNWKIGRFMISGYTRVIEKPSEPLVFLKNAGDGCIKCANRIGAQKRSANMRKKVYQYTLSGEYVKEYDCAASAAAALGISVSAIKNACNPKVKLQTAGGFRWSYLLSGEGNDDKPLYMDSNK